MCSVEAVDDMKGYWRRIKIASSTLKAGLSLTAKHIKNAKNQRTAIVPAAANYFEQENALFTVQYPKEKLPVPDHGRYKLHNEIDDCIVCDKCAKVCPVDCIDIEPVRSVNEIGKTSDGTPRRIYAAKFDIDMAKCCFCGLCTTVCPTECLTMTDDYDFSAYDFEEHNFSFANLTPLEILEKKKELEEFNKQKEAAKKQQKEVKPKPAGARPNVAAAKPKTGGGKPVFKPKVKGSKPKIATKPKAPEDQKQENTDAAKPKPKPVFRPRVQPSKKKEEGNEGTASKKPSKTVIKRKPKDSNEE